MKVLVVDDDELVCDTIVDLLDFMKVKAHKTNNSSEVLPLLQTRNFDYIFVDIVMPGINGLELMKMIKADHPETKLVCISGLRDIMSKEVENLVEFSIQKPVDAEEFIKRMTKIFLHNKN